MKVKLFSLKIRIKRYIGRKWELLRTPKDQRPVKKAIWAAMDKAKQDMANELGERLYGKSKEFDGLGSLLDD